MQQIKGESLEGKFRIRPNADVGNPNASEKEQRRKGVTPEKEKRQKKSSAGLQTGCPEGVLALRALASP
jgi:hypothetical protein